MMFRYVTHQSKVIKFIKYKVRELSTFYFLLSPEVAGGRA